jgi:hypothetical protein
MPEPLTCTVATGRRLAWAEYGDPAGVPLLFLHGAPGGRLSAAPHDQRFARQGLRVIAPERPGYGRSDAASGHTVRDIADDLLALLDACGLDGCSSSAGRAAGPTRSPPSRRPHRPPQQAVGIRIRTRGRAGRVGARPG